MTDSNSVISEILDHGIAYSFQSDDNLQKVHLYVIVYPFL